MSIVIGYEFFCICKSSTGQKCSYRATHKDTNMCGVHHLFKDDKKFKLAFPFTFNNYK